MGDSSLLTGPIGLIAGNGILPIELARVAAQSGIKICAVAHTGETDPKLAEIVSSCSWVKIGQLGKILKSLRTSGVTKVILAGGIKRAPLFGRISFDLEGLLFAARVLVRKDDIILRAVADELARRGIEVIGAHEILGKWVAKAGVATARGLTDAEKRDALIGWEAAHALGKLDIGQTVIVHDGTVVALEAIEGTDMAIQRAGGLTGGRGGVVVKLCKPGQDLRFDLPSIGEGTIRVMKAHGVTAIVLEAERSFILDPVSVASLADRSGISIVAAKAATDL